MSMSTHVMGFHPPDEKWKRMKTIWNACVIADVPVPEEVMEFFGDKDPDDAGVEIGLGSAVRDFSREGESGFDVILSKLPKSIDRIRFYNSW